MLKAVRLIRIHCPLCGYLAYLHEDEERPEKCPACGDSPGQKWTSESNDRNE